MNALYCIAAFVVLVAVWQLWCLAIFGWGNTDDYTPTMQERKAEWKRILTQGGQEVRETAIGWKPDGRYTEGEPLDDGTPTYYRVIRKAKGRK